MHRAGLLLLLVAGAHVSSAAGVDVIEHMVKKYNVDKKDVVRILQSLGDHKKRWLESVLNPRVALLVIDMQHDFINGSLAVGGAPDIVGPLNEFARRDGWGTVVYSKDWHPADHISFYSNLGLRQLDPDWRAGHPGNISLFDTVMFAGNPPREQVLWPDHCVQDSFGAEIHAGLTPLPDGALVQPKGTNPEVDSYSAFFDNQGGGSTGLDARIAGSTEVVVAGLATDYCVGSTVLDALKLDYPSTLLVDLSRAVGDDTEKAMLDRVRAAGGRVMSSKDWIAEQDTWERAKSLAEWLKESQGVSGGVSLRQRVSLALLCLGSALLLVNI